MPQRADRLREPYDSLVDLHKEVQDALPIVVQKEYEEKTCWLDGVLRQVSVDAEQKPLSEALHQVREMSIAIGLGLDAGVLDRFDTARIDFEEVELTKTLEEISALREKGARVDALRELASASSFGSMQVIERFLLAASGLLKETERVIQREINNLEQPGELSVSAVQQRIRDGLEELKQLLTTFGEAQC